MYFNKNVILIQATISVNKESHVSKAIMMVNVFTLDYQNISSLARSISSVKQHSPSWLLLSQHVKVHSISLCLALDLKLALQLVGG